MLTLPSELTSLIVSFAPLFSKPVWQHAQEVLLLLLLLVGVILAPGKRTAVTSAVRVCGLEPRGGATLSDLSSRLEPHVVVFASCEPHPALVARQHLRLRGCARLGLLP